MKYRTLGKDLTVSAMGLGCMGMCHAYGAPADKKEMERLIAEAVDLGITFYDTAEVYGTEKNPHDNEEFLAGALVKPYRDKVVIATKCGLVPNLESKEVPHPLITDSRPETIRKSLEGSLRRLGIDHIDLYYLHRMDPKVPIEDVAYTMAELIREGKITHWGLSEVGEETIRRAHAVCPVTAIQNRYSMMYREYESLFPVLEELRIGFVPFSPLANGFLSAQYNKEMQYDEKLDYRSRMPQFTGKSIEQNRSLIRFLYDLAEKKNATPAQISLAWMIDKKQYISPIPGTTKINRLRENAGAADINLTPEEVAGIDKALDTMEMSAVYGGTKIIK